MATVVIGGDLCPIGRAQQKFADGDVLAVFNGILKVLTQADLVIANLECPLVSHQSPQAKSGPSLSAPTGCIRGLQAAHIDVLGLANNHVMDHGSEGLGSTLLACKAAGIQTVGAGANVADAARMLVRNVGGATLGVLAMAEHEFGIAGERHCGANPLSTRTFVRAMRIARKPDCLIVLLHGGNELYPYPSPRLQDTCRFLIEEGADLVVCQHSHCVGCSETYQGGHIVYGQGNLVFDMWPRVPAPWYKGVLVIADIGRNGVDAVRLVPYAQYDRQEGIRRIDDEELAGFHARSRAILDPELVAAKWAAHCEARRYECYSTLRGHNKWLRRLNERLHYTPWFYPRRRPEALLNMVRCEAHLEVLQYVLETWRGPTRLRLGESRVREADIGVPERLADSVQ